MKILDEFVYENKKYICLSKVYVDLKMVYVCKCLWCNKRECFIENLDGSIKKIIDNVTIEKVESYFDVESKDVIFPKI